MIREGSETIPLWEYFPDIVGMGSASHPNVLHISEVYDEGEDIVHALRNQGVHVTNGSWVRAPPAEQ